MHLGSPLSSGTRKKPGVGGSWAALLQPVFEARIMYRVGSPATLDDINLSCGRRRVRGENVTLQYHSRAYQCYIVRSGLHNSHSTDRSIAARTAALLTEVPTGVARNIDRSPALRRTSLLTQVSTDEA